MQKFCTDVIIPAYRPDQKFEQLLERLQRQSVPPRKILVMNTEQALWEQYASAKIQEAFQKGVTENGMLLELHHVSAEAFDHGGTRAQAAAMSDADVLLFMTQDAVPENRLLVEKLTAALTEDERTAAAYARQLPATDCNVLERYTRSFNYGTQGAVKSAEDLPRLGIKTYFCSNVCAAYRRTVYEALGGFETQTIFNEDMIFAAKAVRAGYQIAYAPEARVIHSHSYSGIQQFHRNFDLAVSQADHPEIFAGVRSEGEGIRLVKKSAIYLCRNGHILLLPKLIWQSACKYAGYLLGKNYRRLPAWMIRSCSMNRKYWKNKLF